eukprot:TRINITY_DN6103_c0_g1_i1.p1 TRINITY_DN6103_c0_g1~~TRINITY_DN6103_c0_g1_i1.p1  ORF type:complete len:393 (-),score=68.64 TRINITY_DN6103_c0_g1_i1:304-1482(-)
MDPSLTVRPPARLIPPEVQTDDIADIPLPTLFASIHEAIHKHTSAGKKLYSLTEETLPLQQLLQKYSRPWHWRVKGLCLCLLAFFMITFVSWSMFKVIRASAYMEIHREEMYWTQSAALPKVAIGNVRLKRNYTMKIEHLEIRDGDYSTRKATPIETTKCDVIVGSANKRGLFKDNTCLPDNLMVRGIYGDALFQYVSIDFYLPRSENLTDGSVSLVVEDKPTLQSSVMFSHYYTFVGNQWTGVEVFFKKIVALKGESLGAFGHTGNDETENFLHRDEYLRYAYEYTRASTAKEYTKKVGDGENDHQRVFTIYLRAGLTETEEFYEVYSILKALEKAGGLWTSLALISSLTLVLIFSLQKRFFRCIHGKGAKDKDDDGEDSDYEKSPKRRGY